MAILINHSTRRKIVLRRSHTFGRHPYNVQTLLTAPDTSQIHASIRFNVDQWEIIDHSRNGSSVDGRQLTHGLWTALKPEQEICFGRDEQSRFQVINLAAPATLLFCDDGDGQIIKLDGQHHLLPDEQNPLLAISLGEFGHWVWEQGEQRRILEDGQHVSFDGHDWEFVCAPDVQSTAELADLPFKPDLNQIVFHFNVSRNEEHVSLKITVGDQTFDLFERVHHYCLLILARQRQADKEKGLDKDSCGWIEFEQFAKMLGLDPSHINIQIFRARHQLIKTVPNASGWPPLVERRRGAVRFGPFKFDRVQGSMIHTDGD